MNNTGDLISIIVPVYKVEKYISRCIESILSQSYRNYEIILVDDASPDNCPQICDDYANKYDNIFVIHLKNSGVGVSDARNAGIAMAKGKYITFIDSDDYAHEFLLEVLKNAIEKSNVLMSMCSYKRVDDSKVEMEIIDNENDVRIISDLEALDLLISDQTNAAVWGKLYNKELFDNLYFPVGRHNEDMFVIPQIFKKAQKIAIVPQKLYFYYQQNESLCRSEFNYNMLDMLEAISFWREQAKLYYPELFEKATIHYFSTVIDKCQNLVKKNDEYCVLKYKAFKEDILNNYHYIIHSKYTTKNNKIKMMLFKYGLFRLFFRTYK